MKLNIIITKQHFFVLFLFDDLSGSTLGARCEENGVTNSKSNFFKLILIWVCFIPTIIEF